MKTPPKVEAVFSEMELVGAEFTIRRGVVFEDDDDDDDDGGPITVIVDPDPGVTETITCTEMVCSSSEFASELASFEARFVLPENVQLPDTVTVRMRSSRRKA